MTTKKNCAVFDADSHVVEPKEVWTQYLEPEYRTLGKHALWRADGEYNCYLKSTVTCVRYYEPQHSSACHLVAWHDLGANGDLDPNTRHAMTGRRLESPGPAA
jgi:hypothetical protein